MIIIIRAFPQWGKYDGDYDSPTSRDETPDFMKNRKGQRSPNKKKGAKEAHQKKRENKKMREKERMGNLTILLPQLCFKVVPCSSYRESLILALSYTSGNFHYRTWLSYKLDAHPLSFSLSFHTLIAPVHPLHGNPYSSHWHLLMGISIAHWYA